MELEKAKSDYTILFEKFKALTEEKLNGDDILHQKTRQIVELSQENKSMKCNLERVSATLRTQSN